MMELKSKICKLCMEDKSLDMFHKHKGRKLGVTDLCKPCRNTHFVEKRYGLAKGQLIKMKEKVDYKCEICYNKLPLAVDHCHETGSIRGLLCGNCNNGLGRFKDNIEYIKNAIKYLEKENEKY